MCKKLLILIFLFAAFNLSYADLQSAVDSLKLEIEKKPDDYLLHFKLGSCYYSSGEYEEALQEFNRSVDLNKDFFAAKFKIAIISIYMDKPLVAKEILEELKKTHPDKKSVYRWLGWVYGFLGQYEKMSEASLEKLGKDTEAKIYWFKCYGKLPLGIDVESMRNFIDKFICTIKS